MPQTAEIYLAGDHPTAAGHFPSDPILPGALMLDEVVAAIAGPAAGDRKVLIRAAKFLQKIRPGERVNLSWRTIAAGTIKFECQRAGESGLAMTGTIEIGP